MLRQPNGFLSMTETRDMRNIRGVSNFGRSKNDAVEQFAP